MTKVPMDKLQTFVRGSHETVHGPKGVITLVRKHNGKDYAPGEVKEIAEKILDLAEKSTSSN